MATYTLGQAAVIDRGAYNAATTYAPLNLVTNFGGSFLCKATCTGVEPGVTSGWQTYWTPSSTGIKAVIAQAGSSGDVLLITFTDGTTTTLSYPTAIIGPGAIKTIMIDNSQVTGAKIAYQTITADKLSPLLSYTAVNLTAEQVVPIYIGTDTPTAETLPEGAVYIKYTEPPEPEES